MTQFYVKQRVRIGKRIKAAENAIKGERVDARLKALHVLPSLKIALTRIDAGLYGSCLDCEGKIGRLRLEKIPGAIRCIPCQEQHEK